MSADVRQQLAEALEDQFAYAVSHATIEIDWNEEADALLPVVERIAVARAAHELRDAAAELRRGAVTLDLLATRKAIEGDLLSEYAYGSQASDLTHVAGRLGRRADALDGGRP